MGSTVTVFLLGTTGPKIDNSVRLKPAHKETGLTINRLGHVFLQQNVPDKGASASSFRYERKTLVFSLTKSRIVLPVYDDID